MYDHMFMSLLITKSNIRPGVKWAGSLAIADGHFNLPFWFKTFYSEEKDWVQCNNALSKSSSLCGYASIPSAEITILVLYICIMMRGIAGSQVTWVNILILSTPTVLWTLQLVIYQSIIHLQFWYPPWTPWGQPPVSSPYRQCHSDPPTRNTNTLHFAFTHTHIQ